MKERLQDTLWWVGIVLIAVSSLLFCMPQWMNVLPNDYFNLFVFHYSLTLLYLIILLVKGRLRRGREGIYPLFLLLILSFISAYALNREMKVFEESAPWFTVVQVVLCFNFVLFPFFDAMPRIIKHLMFVLLGVSFIVFGYLTCYLIPMCLVGMIACLFFGVSLHAFVPLLFVVYTCKLVNRITANNKPLWYSLTGGAAVVLVFTIYFVVQFTSVTRTISERYRKADVVQVDDLPAWVNVSQNISNDWITERAIKSDLVYSIFNESNGNFNLFRMPSRNFGEQSIHDPLVMLSSFFVGYAHIDEADRIKILESLYDARHQAQERLWTGRELYTEHVNTAVRIWPQFGMAYTEKTVTVTSTATWNDRQEGIYTFHMPEGAVVTALSLWIEGKEEKGVLTTRAKADSAYTTIVGRESRDPSVVHWQEGNTVSVRVFPILANKSRMFKLGITAPLLKRNNKLVYENIWFDGPSAFTASEDVQLEFQQTPHSLVTPAVFSEQKPQVYKSTGSYKPDWDIAMDEQPLSTQSFCFDGQAYTVRPYVPQRVPVSFSNVYLDINHAWSRSEFEMVYDLLKDKKVFVYNHELVQLTDANKEQQFKELQGLHFSLFPFFNISDTANSLLISKSPEQSPNLRDLKESRHMKQLQAYLATKPTVRLFNIGSTLSPYLKSLKEYRLFHYEQGSTKQLKELLATKTFAASIENDNQVVIDDAGLALVQSPCAAGTSQAPDHLLRLFAYNHVMQKTGSRLLVDQPIEDETVQEAEKAYVVSPVSSLVVLERQADYDRFDIKNSKNSLDNASMKSKGAVPEPHEWALIIIAIFAVLTIWCRPILQKRKA